MNPIKPMTQPLFKTMNFSKNWSALLLLVLTAGGAAAQQTFDSPQSAVSALTAAAAQGDTNTLHQIFGPVGQELASPDPVQAAEDRQAFLARLAEKVVLATNTDGRVTLAIGTDGWPFPIPLVQTDGQWAFDPAAGKEEILARRIGRDEIGAINVCHAYVDAQREYASQDRQCPHSCPRIS